MSSTKTKINLIRYELCFDMPNQRRIMLEEELKKLKAELNKYERFIDAQNKAA